MKRIAAALLILVLLLAACENDCNCRRGSMHYGTRINSGTGEFEYCSCESK